MILLGLFFFFAASAIALSPLLWVSTPLAQMLVLGLAPVTVGCIYVTACVVLGRLFLRASRRAGLVSPRHWTRDLYAMSWALFEGVLPLYSVAVRWRWTRAFIFRLFGYSGGLSFKLAAGTRLQELPWIQLDQGAAVLQNAALTPTLTLATGQILTQAISIGRGAEVGLNSLLLPGVQLLSGARVGAKATLGVCVRVEPDAQVGDGACLDRGVVIGSRAKIGRHVYLGAGAVIGPGIQIKEGASIASGARIESQNLADHLWMEETAALNEARMRALRIVFLREDG